MIGGIFEANLLDAWQQIHNLGIMWPEISYCFVYNKKQGNNINTINCESLEYFNYLMGTYHNIFSKAFPFCLICL